MEILKVIGLLAVFPGSLILIFVVGYFDYKSDEKKFQARLKADNDWLAEEMKKPKYVVRFITDQGEIKRTSTCDPYNTNAGSKRWNYRSSSKAAAEKYMLNCHERGWFTDTNGTTYPACNLREASVEESNGTAS